MALVFLSTTVLAENSQLLQDNTDIALALSQTNYNRIVVKNDKIIEAVFPPNSMAIKRDEQDGSVYVMLAASQPFTLFLTTEAGRHFSATLSGEASLGKTIELQFQQQPITKSASTQVKRDVKGRGQSTVPEVILAMLDHMEQQKPLADVKVRRQFGKVARWSKGLALLPKEVWQAKQLTGETIELYNGGKVPLDLAETWFTTPATLAIKISKKTIRPGERATLYRIDGVKHG